MYNETGQGNGVGSNLNIVWGTDGMGNVEYAGAFQELVLPVVSSFNPDLILIGCGLDAAKGDLLGDCGLTPDMYYMMTESLLEQVGSSVPVVVALEGGYNLPVISKCLQAVALALMDEPYYECTDGLSDFWYHNQCHLTHRVDEAPARAAKKISKTSYAMSSIKKSARALARSRYLQFAPIQKLRLVEPINSVSEFNNRCHRLSLSASDRYPVKKRVMLRAAQDGYMSNC